MDTRQASAVLSALANETRLGIFRTLVSKGGMPASDLADSVGLAPSNLSFHLKDMRFAGLVSSRRQGRQIIYVADFENLNALLEFLAHGRSSASASSSPPTRRPEPAREHNP
jgi:DNA-binding transcriptional ArsR family regulator